MATITWSNHAKSQLMKKQIDMVNDSLKALLMRSGFTFNKDNHETKKNLMCNSGAILISFVAGTQKITRGSGSFITDGFVIGNRITTDAALNPGPFTISNVAALEITCASGIVDEAGVTKTVTSNDELATANGYTRDTFTLAGKAVGEDDANDRGEFTCTDPSWTASGGNIGPSPGMIVYSDTSADDTILFYIDFGGEQTAPTGQNFIIANIKARLT